jgi:quercetin dioxygenase-like cupin family protein
MRYSTGIKFAAVALSGVAALGTMGGAAIASPGNGVTPETYTTATLAEDAQVNHDRIKFQTKDPTSVRVQKLTFAAGSYTGWHHHPGAVIVAVQSGSVTLVDEDCSTRVYGPGMPDGAVFIEGHDESHEARSAAGATVYVTYVVPDSVFRVEEPARTCS